MAALNYYSHDAATGASTHQTQAQFHDSLTADIQRALNAGCLDESPKVVKKGPRPFKYKPIPQHGLAAFLDVSGGLQAQPVPPTKKGPKKPTVEKFSLDEV